MIWADQTLNEGLRIGMDKGNLDYVVELLQSMQVGVIDVSVSAWQTCGLPPLSLLQQQQLRGKVNGRIEEVELAYTLGFKNIIISCEKNHEFSISNQIDAALGLAQKRALQIGLYIENATDFPIDEMEGLWRDVSTMGVKTFIYSDGDSRLNPLSTYNILTALAQRIPVKLEFHGHNAYGLATANSLGAIEAGVEGIAVAVGGVGLRGHAASEEMLMACKQLLGKKITKTEILAGSCLEILRSIGVELPRTKAIVGQDIFAHESGIHVDGVLKNPQLYEAFSPEEVGLTRKLVIGKHSGTASIQSKFREWDVSVSTIDTQYLLKKVRSLAVLQKRAIDDDTLWQLYQGRVVQEKG
jgi:homocitrate synthase NifV